MSFPQNRISCNLTYRSHARIRLFNKLYPVMVDRTHAHAKDSHLSMDRVSRLGIVAVGSDTDDVGDGTEVLELVGVDDGTHRVDHPVEHFEGPNAGDLALGITVDHPRSTIDEYRFDG